MSSIYTYEDVILYLIVYTIVGLINLSVCVYFNLINMNQAFVLYSSMLIGGLIVVILKNRWKL